MFVHKGFDLQYSIYTQHAIQLCLWVGDHCKFNSCVPMSVICIVIQ